MYISYHAYALSLYNFSFETLKTFLHLLSLSYVTPHATSLKAFHNTKIFNPKYFGVDFQYR